MTKLKYFFNQIIEYFILLIKYWWFVLLSILLEMIDIYHLYICPSFSNKCSDHSPSLSLLSITSFIIANFLIFNNLKKENNILRKKIKIYEDKTPILELFFSNNKKHKSFNPIFYIKKEKPVIATNTTINDKINTNIDTNILTSLQNNLIQAIKPFQLLAQERNEHQSEIEEWEREIKSYSKIKIKIVNDGKVPARDIDICLDFPEFIELHENLPEKPNYDYFSRLSRFPIANMVTDFWVIVKDNKATLHCKKIKHGHQELFESFYIKLKNYEEKIMKIPYEITADNLPKPQIGSLSFKIKPIVKEYD